MRMSAVRLLFRTNGRGAAAAAAALRLRRSLSGYGLRSEGGRQVDVQLLSNVAAGAPGLKPHHQPHHHRRGLAAAAGESGKGWWQGMKDKVASKVSGEVSAADMSLDSFASELKKARTLGSLSAYAPNMSSGATDQRVVAAQMKQQEDIINSMTPGEKADLSTFGSAEVQRVATAVGCTEMDVNNTIRKFQWTKTMLGRVEQLKKDGKPMPRSMADLEKLTGGDWRGQAAGSRALPGEKVGRNQKCPCGSGKSYKACCMKKGNSAG